MTSFQVATGHDQAGSLAAVTPQPRSTGLKYAEQVIMTDGTKILKGLPFCEWVWDYLEVDAYDTLLTACGLDATTPTVSAAVTVKTLQNDFSTFANYNATVHLPDSELSIDWDRGKIMRVVLRFVAMEAL